MKNNSVRAIAKMLTRTLTGNVFSGGFQNDLEAYPTRPLSAGAFGMPGNSIPSGMPLPPNAPGAQGMQMQGMQMQEIVSTNLTGEEWNGIMLIVVTCDLLIIVSYILLQYSEYHKAKKAGRTDMPTFAETLGFKGSFNAKNFFIGMMTNIIFGFIDNAGLFFGMDNLDPLFAKKFGAGELTKAGLGNTFSDMLGSFLGTFIGNGISNYTDVDEWPIIADVIGIVIGCLLGLYIPKMIKCGNKEC